MKEIHYFQRYHTSENVHTGNAMLLLNRLFNYRPKYFYMFLEGLMEDEAENYKFDLLMGLQEKNSKAKAIPDAIILQNGYRICIEAKIGDCFYEEQIKRHIETFNDYITNYKILITLSNSNVCKLDKEFRKLVEDYNKEHLLKDSEKVVYKHLTFEMLIEMIDYILQDRDYEFKDILEDYESYCNDNGLIDNGYKMMKVRKAGSTYAINRELNLYYDDADNGFSSHKYLGLYADKSIKTIGEVKKIIKAKMTDGIVEIIEGNPTREEENKIGKAIVDAEKYGYDLQKKAHNYFMVDKFVDCSFLKKSKGSLQGSKKFNLQDDYGIDDIKNKTIEEIAMILSQKTWS